MHVSVYVCGFWGKKLCNNIRISFFPTATIVSICHLCRRLLHTLSVKSKMVRERERNREREVIMSIMILLPLDFLYGPTEINGHHNDDNNNKTEPVKIANFTFIHHPFKGGEKHFPFLLLP